MEPDDLRRGAIKSRQFRKVGVLVDKHIAVLCRMASDGLIIRRVEARKPGLKRAGKQVS